MELTMPNENDPRLEGIPSWLLSLYNALPSPPQQEAPIDQLLKSPVNFGRQLGQPMHQAISSIIQGLGFGRMASAKEPVYDQFGVPVEPSYNTILDKSTGKPKRIRIDPVAEFPPPGLSDEQTVAWAIAHPPPPDRRLPEANTTTVEKAPAEMPALPTKKPTKKISANDPKFWTTIVNGLGGAKY